MLEVTIDTNVFYEHARKQENWEVAEKVFALAKQGKIDMNPHHTGAGRHTGWAAPCSTGVVPRQAMVQTVSGRYPIRFRERGKDRLCV